MNKPRHPVIVILVTLACAALIFVRSWLGLGCVVYETLGIPCLTCGMTRAVTAALRLDFKSAFGYHPLFITLPILYQTVITELSPFKSKLANKITVVSLASAFLGVWIVRLALILI